MTLMAVALVEGADRLVIQARLDPAGLHVWFADGAHGVVPAPVVRGSHRSEAAAVQIPDPHRVVVRFGARSVEEFPWDYLRGFCDAAYEAKARGHAAAGRQALGARLRMLRADRTLTQAALAKTAGVGRVTLARIEAGTQTASLATLEAIAAGLRVSLVELLPSARG